MRLPTPILRPKRGLIYPAGQLNERSRDEIAVDGVKSLTFSWRDDMQSIMDKVQVPDLAVKSSVDSCAEILANLVRTLGQFKPALCEFSSRQTLLC